MSDPGGAAGSRSTWLSVAISAVSALAAIAALFVSCNANSIAKDALIQAKGPEGAILSPTTLSDGVCHRFSGYTVRLPANSTLWVFNRTSNSPRAYGWEVPRDGALTTEEKGAAQAVSDEALPWVAAVQVGDSTIQEPSETYFVSLYWADQVQSKALRETNDQPGFVIPSDMGKQFLGKEVVLSQPQHVAVPKFVCDLTTAR